MIISTDTPGKIEAIKAKNKKVAEVELQALIDEYRDIKTKEELGLVTEKDDFQTFKDRAKLLSEDIANPSADIDYKPIKIEQWK